MWQHVAVVPSVFIVGTEQLPLVPEFLSLGSVVVIAPDRETLHRWRQEHETDDHVAPHALTGTTVVDLAGRKIETQGTALPLSDLEFRVVRALLAQPGTALSFADLRREGWGDGPEMPFDVYSVRALVQRVRAKLRAANASFEIVAVRGFGFRADQLPAAVATSQHALPATGRLTAVPVDLPGEQAG